MINFHDFIKEETKEHNHNWSQIPDHPYRILKLEALDQEKQIHYLI